MVLKRLPLEVQSLFCASTQIKTFKTAVEELVYNAFDANSTSIAIRVNIQENYIQLVDNGHGVSKDYFYLLGQRYTTSRYEDSITSKSNQKYGNSGQSLANIIQISQSVKITSRCENSEETWFKHFYNGKEKECILTSSRPSVGTTVEIEGFLYNLTIQKKATNAVQEIQRTKTFLEQMSLVHCKTSISLRDNSENEIIFKIHKNRDVHQTLSLLIGIEKSNLQELQVEKKQYKVTGFIQKQDTDTCGFQWIFVNRRFIENSNLHQIISHNLVKGLTQKIITKTKNHNNERNKITTNNKIPDYFIFIECPQNDYEVICNPKQAMLEFKDCSQISKLLEKLTKFYNGEISLKTKITAKNYVEEKKSKTNDTNTRKEVKIIMEKILGSRHKKINGSQLHNGIKGKNIKRKRKRNLESNSKCNMNPKDKKDRTAPTEMHKFSDFTEQNEQQLKKVKDSDIKYNDCKFNIHKQDQIRNKTSINANKLQKLHKKSPQETKNCIVTKDPIISKFEKETGEVHKRCQILAKKVDDLLGFKKNRKCKIFTNEYFQYSTVITDSKKMTIRKKVDEVIIHEYLPLPPKARANIVMKSHDLLRPVTTTSKQNNVEINEFRTNTVKQQTDAYECPKSSPCNINIPRLTYESHCYIQDTEVHHERQKVFEKYKDSEGNERKFITHVSQNHLLSPKKRIKEIVDSHVPIPAKKHAMAKKPSFMKTGNSKQADELQSSYSIHLNKTGSQPHETPNIMPIISDFTAVNDKSPIENTYTIIDPDKPIMNDVPPKMIIQNTVNVYDFQDTYCAEALHGIDYGVDQSLNHDNSHIKRVTPEDCETYSVKATHLKNDYTDESSKLHCPLEVDETPEIHETYFVEATLSQTDKYYTDQPPDTQEFLDSLNRNTNASSLGSNKFNVIFISNSQQSDIGTILDKDIDPVHICETVLYQQDSYGNEYNFIFNSMNDIIHEQNVAKPTESCVTKLYNESKNEDSNILIGINQNGNEQLNPDGHKTDFNIKNRRRYIPKGMSQIFENCNTKGVCNYEIDKDYFEDTVYNNFVDDVQINSEIFEPRIQNVKELATRDIERVNNKLNKDNASLTFNGDSLKRLKVLGQVDYKFIATKIKDKLKGRHDYLVLFDQHAVDERIRLEKNMAEYFDGDQWKSVTLDGISLKLNKDEVLYLHNYKKKFHKLGLQWTILDNREVSVTAIPEAILGKNPRQVETVWKAVKSLIKEEIKMIKEQGGCVSLYPKSIMDLVFSEACRYAIMFGDALSKIYCMGLLNALSECKTPFQCAHGRPVMAVLMDIKTEKHEYKINLKSIQQFRRRMQNLNK